MKQKIVIDTNILFAALRVKNSKVRSHLLNQAYEFYAPKYLFVEIFKHKERIEDRPYQQGIQQFF